MPKETKIHCPSLRASLDALHTKKAEFDAALKQASQTGDFTILHTLKPEIETLTQTLWEQINPFEKIHLREQVISQLSILKETHLLTTLSDGREGIQAINHKEYPAPSFEKVLQRLLKKRELIEQKMAQGFTKLLIVPHGKKLEDVATVYKEELKNHFTAGKLFYPENDKERKDREKAGATRTPVPKLNAEGSLWIWYKDQEKKTGGYGNADVDGALVYYPSQFPENPKDYTPQIHKGTTKMEMLDEMDGFDILLVEDLTHIPKEGQGKIIGGRKQLEANQTLINYLAKQQAQEETGLTPEAWLILAQTKLKENNEVTDDWQGNGKACWNTGAYFKVSGDIPDAYWARDDAQAHLNRDDPANRNADIGARSAVRIL